MSSYLLIDFGASRVKSALLDVEKGSFSSFKDNEPVSGTSKEKEFFEVDASLLSKQFKDICSYYCRKKKIKGILLSSQMHGFIALDEKGRRLTEYISWKDERSLQAISGVSSFSFALGLLGNDFKAITGMTPRPGLPFFNLIHLGRQKLLKGRCRIITLPQWLQIDCCSGDGTVHSTMIAGLGFYDVKNAETSEKLVKFVKEYAGIDCYFDTVSKECEVTGYFPSGSERIPVYAAVGDHQCAVLGAGNIPQKTISVNIGTGSQVSMIDPEFIPESDFRPFFEGSLLYTITHIPAGRALLVYMGFLNDLAEKAGSKNDFWKKFSRVTLKEAVDSSLDIDLALFKSAWGYDSGGRITGISERNFTVSNYIASLLRCLAQQYARAIKQIDPKETAESVILSGGVARKSPLIADLLKHFLKRSVRGAAKEEETFLGLNVLALLAEKKGRTISEAMKVLKNDR